MTWELDKANFKVVCQRCGKVSVVNIDEDDYEGVMVLRALSVAVMLSNDTLFYDHWLCEDCKDK